MNVGDGLAECHHRLTRIEFARKQYRQQIFGDGRLYTVLFDRKHAIFMMADELAEALAYAEEG